MGRLKVFFLFFSIIFVFIFSAFGVFFSIWINEPCIEKSNIVEYYIPKQTSLGKISSDLENLKIISHPKLFVIYSELLGHTKHIKYGTYAFTDKDSPKSILERLVRGDTVLIKITLPEGLNIYQLAEKLHEYFQDEAQEKWLTLFTSPSFIHKLNLKEQVSSLEGFLFPDTYFFDPHVDAEYVVKAIISDFKKNVTQETFDKAMQMGLSPLQFITLASIIEKETGISAERYKVSAVYWNRIKKGMMLQADPTVIYGLWNSMQGPLTKKELHIPTPYNTYTFRGLPKGPIASPGLNSILATLNPEKIKALYFVASGRGGHVFSNTLAEHNRAVQQYRTYLKQEKN